MTNKSKVAFTKEPEVEYEITRISGNTVVLKSDGKMRRFQKESMKKLLASGIIKEVQVKKKEKKVAEPKDAP